MIANGFPRSEELRKRRHKRLEKEKVSSRLGPDSPVVGRCHRKNLEQTCEKSAISIHFHGLKSSGVKDLAPYQLSTCCASHATMAHFTFISSKTINQQTGQVKLFMKKLCHQISS